MKKKYTLILLFMLAFTGVTLLVYTPALADWGRFCTEDELVAGTCIEITEPDNGVVYILKAFVSFGIPDDPSDPGDPVDSEESLVLGENWPIHDIANKRTIFRYITGAADPDKYGVVKKPSAQSYTVFSLCSLPALGTDPSGAQLDLSKLHSSCGSPELGARKALKLNKVASFSKDGIIELYEPLYTNFDDQCGYAWVVWSDNCNGGRMVVPACTATPIQKTTSFKCEDSGVTVTVEIDPCTRQINSVNCGDLGPAALGKKPSWAYVKASDPDDPSSSITKSFQFGQAGPGTPGCIACMNPYPIVVRGNEIWWCGDEP